MEVIFRDYGGGLVEYGYSKRERSSPLIPVWGRVPLVSTPEEIAERAARRARTVIRRRIMALGLDHLLTLTYRANVIDFRASALHLRKFIRIVRVRFPGYRWVAVPERQLRGAWHWHLAVKGWQDVRFLREAWQRVIGEGNIDVRGPKSKARVGKLKLAYYLVKYISKELEDVNTGLHRYFGTREKGDVSCVKISVDRILGVGYWIGEILAEQRQAVRQNLETAFGGWGATWAKVGRIHLQNISLCTA